MSCKHTTFFLVLVNMPSGKRWRSQTKEVAVNVYEYFEELGRRKRTEGSLKQTCDATVGGESDESDDSDQSDSSDDE